jgi:hypothetical protein
MQEQRPCGNPGVHDRNMGTDVPWIILTSSAYSKETPLAAVGQLGTHPTGCPPRLPPAELPPSWQKDVVPFMSPDRLAAGEEFCFHLNGFFSLLSSLSPLWAPW